MSAFQPSSAATSDRLVNKVAMCGALFAGVAFVGYRIVKNAVKKNRNKSDQGNYFKSRYYGILIKYQSFPKWLMNIINTTYRNINSAIHSMLNH